MKKKELDKAKLIEYNGDFYTPEELAEKLGVSGDFEVVLRDADETWFGRAMKGNDEKNNSNH